MMDDTDCANDLYSLVFGIRPGQAHKLTDFVKGMLLLFPLKILEEMLTSAQGGLELFDNDSFSPLLIWDGHSRASFASIIKRSAAKAASAHTGDENMWPAKNMLPSAKLPPFLVPRKDLSSTGKALLPRCCCCTSNASAEILGVMNHSSYACLATGEDNPTVPLYLGSFFVDSFLRNPMYPLTNAQAERFGRELLKAVWMSSPSLGASSIEFRTDDRKRLVLALLLLYMTRYKKGDERCR